MHSLTDRVLNYHDTGEGLSELVESISWLIYSFPVRRAGFDEDDCGEFLLYLRPRIPSFIHNFTYSGKPFEAYLQSCLKWQLRSFGGNKTRASRQYRVSNTPDRWEEIRGSDLVAEVEPAEFRAPTPHPGTLFIPKQKRQRRACSGRRLVILAMKGCLRLQHQDIETLSRVTGYGLEWLQKAWSTLCGYSERRLATIHRLRTRRNRTFFRVLCLEDELATLEPSARYDRLKEERDRLMKRLRSLQRRISRVHVAPTNKEIADVCQIPKGSVDSTLYYMRTLWKKGNFPAPEECEQVGGLLAAAHAELQEAVVGTPDYTA